MREQKDKKLENMFKLMDSDEYRAANEGIDTLVQKLERANGEKEVRGILAEKESFFSKLRKQDKELEGMLRVRKNMLTERIVKKLTGNDVIVD